MAVEARQRETSKRIAKSRKMSIGEVQKCEVKEDDKKTTAPRIPVWSPTMVLTRRHFG